MIEPLISWYGLRHSRDWIIPSFFFLLLVALAYGPMVPFLGFYWDDWPVIYQIDVGADFWSFYSYDRPLSAWTYKVFAPLLGIRPLGWHLLGLLLRWLAAMGMWWNIRLLWPTHRQAALWIGLIFTLHPAFTLQPIAVAFSQHLLAYTLFLVSTAAMLLGVRNPARLWPLTALGISTQALHMLTLEYFWGLELLRPVLLWMVLPGEKKERFFAMWRSWVPYLGVYLLIVYWRAFILELPGGDPNELALLDLIRQNPLLGLRSAAFAALQDIIHILLPVWTESLQLDPGDNSQRFLLYSWLWALGVGGLTFAGLRRFSGLHSKSSKRIFRPALWLGAGALLLSMAPIWITGNQITRGLYGARFALPALFGASILLIGLMDYFVGGRVQKVLILSVLAGLAAGAHLRNANSYRWDWHKQSLFFWQFNWRVPGLEPGTALISDGAVFRYAGGYPTSAAINTVYNQAYPYPLQTYWFFELDNTYWREMETFLAGVEMRGSLRNLVFSGHSQDGLALFFEPETGSCLRVLSAQDRLVPMLPDLTAQAAAISNLSRIQPVENADQRALEAIFGPEPEPSWCYFYQKAELALQFGEYAAVTELEKRVVAGGLTPNDPTEWFPFIEAQSRLGNWDAAVEWTLAAFEKSVKPRDRAAFCDLWQRIDQFSGRSAPEALACDKPGG